MTCKWFASKLQNAHHSRFYSMNRHVSTQVHAPAYAYLLKSSSTLSCKIIFLAKILRIPAIVSITACNAPYSLAHTPENSRLAALPTRPWLHCQRQSLTERRDLLEAVKRSLKTTATRISPGSALALPRRCAVHPCPPLGRGLTDQTPALTYFASILRKRKEMLRLGRKYT